MKTAIYRQRIKLSILWISKLLGLFYLTRILTRRMLLIFCYHGFELLDESSFRPSLFMRRETFTKRLQMLHRYGSPVLTLDEASRRLQENSLPDNAVCLTIDDGFYSVLVHAAPLLKRYGFPATLYITSYYVAKATPIFRLTVQYMFWKTRAKILDVTDEAWGVPTIVDLSDRMVTDRAMWRIIEFGETKYDEQGRERISEILGDRLAVEYSAIRKSRIMTLLTPNEIRQLDKSGINIQLHTHRHRLPTDDEAAARQEIVENIRFLETVIKRPFTHLCYPSGIWNVHQWSWLATLGIKTATTCDPAMNMASTPLLGLYRVVDENRMSQIEFEAELSGFSELVRRISGRRKRLDLARTPNCNQSTS